MGEKMKKENKRIKPETLEVKCKEGEAMQDISLHSKGRGAYFKYRCLKSDLLAPKNSEGKLDIVTYESSFRVDYQTKTLKCEEKPMLGFEFKFMNYKGTKLTYVTTYCLNVKMKVRGEYVVS